MSFQTRVTELLGIGAPILQAGMAGGITTPSLVAAVSNAGALGMVGAGYLTAEELRASIGEIRKLTDKPFGVNLFIPGQTATPDDGVVDEMMSVLEPYRRELELQAAPFKPTNSPAETASGAQKLAQQLAVVIEEKVPVLSYTFGVLQKEYVDDLHRAGIRVIGTATSVREALAVEAAGADCIVGQGFEAGGHRGTFMNSNRADATGIAALIPQLADAVSVPVIAAGGLMDGRGLVAALALGASAVQMGTVFLTSHESGAHAVYKQAILQTNDESTVVTRVFSGKPARGIRNRFIEEMAEVAAKGTTIPPFPVQNVLTREMRRAAAKASRSDLMSLWAGQGSALSVERTADDVVREVMKQAEAVLNQLR